MSQLQPLIRLQQTTDPPLNVQEMQLWLDKAVAWGQADSPDTQRDTCLHLSRLRDFLQQLLTHINNMSSTTETMKTLPFLGQFLGRLCWNPYVTADATSRGLLFQCLWGLYSEHPGSAVERKANQWIRKVLCQLATEEDDAAAQPLMKHMGVPPKEYHLKVLRKTVALLQENVGKSCNSLNDINHRIAATSEACVPLVTCPEAAPLIGALLQQPVTCVKAVLSEDFLDALSSAYSSQCLPLEDQAVISLWYHNLSSLEEAVLRLLECVLTNTGSTPQRLEQQVTQSLLVGAKPKACAQHCSMFLVINDIFRSILKQTEGNEYLKRLIQTFTCCFLRELALLQHQTSVPSKALFPQSPQSLLIPLLTLPSEMPQEAWRHHLNWLSGSLQRLTEEEEDREADSSGSTRGHHNVFEAWFLLVQCAHWVQVAVQLLVTSGPEEDCGALLWLLTFYHHPTNKGHHRAQQLVRAEEAWDHLRSLFWVLACSLPVDRLQSLVALLSPQPQQPSLSPLLIINLLVNAAVFSQQSLNGSTEVLRTVVDGFGLADEAACVLSSLELRLNEGSWLSSDAPRVHLRIKAFQSTLTHMGAASSSAEKPSTRTYTL
ncbi:hypothetical protein L3Q82_023221 [Scortum barcoo]|uniref:Uncharacterized protein n=1 Tax=Scortum barcoo TaxID=214431 RepID=A0ACB8WYN4_9TELE|nr:hypothetical protein L3Q82_023221 [Scortum barcoo]